MFRIEKTKESAVEKIQGLEFPFGDVMGIFITGWVFFATLTFSKGWGISFHNRIFIEERFPVKSHYSDLF